MVVDFWPGDADHVDSDNGTERLLENAERQHETLNLETQ